MKRSANWNDARKRSHADNMILVDAILHLAGPKSASADFRATTVALYNEQITWLKA